ncbi:TPA: hypothetical protein ACH3X1_005930 [Trebouxia sp. C0004]
MLRTPTAVVIPVSFSETHLSSGEAQPLRTCQSVRLLSQTPAALSKRAGRRLSCRAEFARQQGSRSSGSGVQDAQETELAAADQHAKQDLYAQLLERRHSSQISEVSASNSVGPRESQAAKAESGSTELIFRLERRGEGWGEEIFPHLVVEQRPWTSAAKRDRNRSSRPKPWTEGSAEQFLLKECGIEESKVDGVIMAAVAWRITPGGRQLIDRRRRSRIERNMLICAEYLVHDCGIEPGSKGVGQIFAKVPQIMLCKPSTNDRWDRRVVQLAAFMHRHGHCNVPEGWTEAPDLAKWVRRQRVARAQGALSEERLQVLYAMGFEFGEVAQLTEEWESKFDQLIEWLLWQDQDSVRKGEFNWLGFDWGRRGGLQARELALWVQLQREFRRRNLLGTDAIKRLEAIGFNWVPEQQGKLWQHRWMHQLGKLLYIVERNRKITAVVGKQPVQEATSPTPPLNPRPVSRSASQRVPDPNLDIVSQRPVKIATGQSRGFPPPFPSRYSPQGSRVGPQGGHKQVTSKGANALQRQIAKRRAALASAHLEAGQGFWLAKQRWLWRRGRLSREQFLMLQLAGLEMDIDPPMQWKRLAHEAAHYLNGSQINPDQDCQGTQTMQQQGQVQMPCAPPGGSASPHSKGRFKQTSALQSESNQPEQQPHFAHKQVPISAQSTWQTEVSSAYMYTLAHTASGATLACPSMTVQQPQLHFQPMVSRPASASTRISSNANGSSSSASLGGANSAANEQFSTPAASAEAVTSQLEAVTSVATADSDACRGGSLYACTPPGRPPGRRCAVLRWVLNQRALWREGQLTPIQMQYMTILGVTWLLSSQVVQMTESIWMKQLMAYRRHTASLGQQIAAEHVLVTSWLLHQRGLYALGLLQPRRAGMLNQLGVSWRPVRTDADILWDVRLSELMSFRQEHGHVKVSCASQTHCTRFLYVHKQNV